MREEVGSFLQFPSGGNGQLQTTAGVCKAFLGCSRSVLKSVLFKTDTNCSVPPSFLLHWHLLCHPQILLAGGIQLRKVRCREYYGFLPFTVNLQGRFHKNQIGLPEGASVQNCERYAFCSVLQKDGSWGFPDNVFTLGITESLGQRWLPLVSP